MKTHIKNARISYNDFKGIVGNAMFIVEFDGH